MNEKNSSETEPTFPYYLYWNVEGRKGQKCRILKAGTKTAHIVFEDGYSRIIDRQAIRQVKNG